MEKFRCTFTPYHNQQHMKFDLQRALVVFDLETTGTDVSTDRIAEFAGVRIEPDGTIQELQFYVNPGKPMSTEAADITGLKDEFLAPFPQFADRALEIKNFMANADFAGYNIVKFDVPLLRSEFLRVGVDFDMDGVNVLDAFAIFCHLVPRTLTGAVKFFLKQEMDANQAHGALYDVQMSANVLAHQLTHHMAEMACQTFADVDKLCNPEPIVDIARKLTRNSTGEVCWTFGKHKGKAVWYDMGYCTWFMSGNFPMESKKQVSIALEQRNAAVRSQSVPIPLQ